MRAPRDEVLTIDELCVYLKLSKSTAYKLAQEGSLPGQSLSTLLTGNYSSSPPRAARATLTTCSGFRAIC